jgi:hypothetical protein
MPRIVELDRDQRQTSQVARQTSVDFWSEPKLRPGPAILSMLLLSSGLWAAIILAMHRL